MIQKVTAPAPDASVAESALPLHALNLPYLPMQTPEFARDPMPYVAAARETHPWLARSDAGYVVHQLRAIKDLLARDDVMRTSFDGIVALMGAKNTPWGRFTEEQMLAHSGASHKRLRDLLAPRFTPRQADRHRPLMRKVIAELLDEWAPRGQCDFEEFASYFPVSVLCALVGAPATEIPRLRASLEALGLGFSLESAHLPALQEAIGILDDFVQELVRERRANGRPEGESDLLDLLLDVSGEGQLTAREVYDMLIFLFVAGYDTSKNVLTYTMHLLLDQPDIYQRCAADLNFCQQAIEEALRYFSPSTVFRMPTRDIIYEGVLIPKDTMIFFPLSIAGRDPSSRGPTILCRAASCRVKTAMPPSGGACISAWASSLRAPSLRKDCIRSRSVCATRAGRAHQDGARFRASGASRDCLSHSNPSRRYNEVTAPRCMTKD